MNKELNNHLVKKKPRQDRNTKRAKSGVAWQYTVYA